MPTKAKDTPLGEVTLRKYESPGDLSDRELVRKLCLSLGLLQPGDSRDVIVDVFHVLLTAEKALTSKELEHFVIEARQKASVPVLGVAPSNIRRQVFRLRDMFMIEKVKNTYRVREKEKLLDLFQEHIERYMLHSILGRVKEYLKTADSRFFQ